ncbi:hypothetical protein BS78_10G197100 [Paspalum vaginatum]|nr:hypothetical protein BS78_10G197100 [Paspalum vaginatum]
MAVGSPSKVQQESQASMLRQCNTQKAFPIHNSNAVSRLNSCSVTAACRAGALKQILHQDTTCCSAPSSPRLHASTIRGSDAPTEFDEMAVQNTWRSWKQKVAGANLQL